MDTESGASVTPKPNDDNEEITFVGYGVRRPPRRSKAIEDEEPLIDTTVALPKKSKKTERAQKRLKQRQQKVAGKPKETSLLDLPPELLETILAFLRPSDIYRILATSRSLNFFTRGNANAIARDIIQQRYWVLSRCFPLPVPFETLDKSTHPALLSERRQDMIQMHRKPYQHVKGVDERKVCTCSSCILAWNNLCLALDLAHWQPLLDKREPLPTIPRGEAAEWNRKLLNANAAIVEKAMHGDMLCYALILEKHLRSITSTLLRVYRGKKTIHPNRLYHITHADAEKDSDEFLERSGPPSVSFCITQSSYICSSHG